MPEDDSCSDGMTADRIQAPSDIDTNDNAHSANQLSRMEDERAPVEGGLFDKMPLRACMSSR